MNINNTSVLKHIFRIFNEDSEEVKREEIKHLSNMDAKEFNKEFLNIGEFLSNKNPEVFKQGLISILSNPNYKSILDSLKEDTNIDSKESK